MSWQGVPHSTGVDWQQKAPVTKTSVYWRGYISSDVGRLQLTDINMSWMANPIGPQIRWCWAIAGTRPVGDWKTKLMNRMRCWSGKQWSWWSVAVMWSHCHAFMMMCSNILDKQQKSGLFKNLVQPKTFTFSENTNNHCLQYHLHLLAFCACLWNSRTCTRRLYKCLCLYCRYIIIVYICCRWWHFLSVLLCSYSHLLSYISLNGILQHYFCLQQHR